MKSKKGQGISFNVIVIAAVALIVLVVLILIFTGRTGKVTEGIEQATGASSCTEDLGGTCEISCDADEDEVLAQTDCIKNAVRIHCCVKK